MSADELEKAAKEILKLSPSKNASIARAMIEGAVRHARRKKKANM